MLWWDTVMHDMSAQKLLYVKYPTHEVKNPQYNAFGIEQIRVQAIEK
jgi:hypothetical protein